MNKKILIKDLKNNKYDGLATEFELEARSSMEALQKIRYELGMIKDSSPEQIIEKIRHIKQNMLKKENEKIKIVMSDSPVSYTPNNRSDVRLNFRDELLSLINIYSKENESNTPDFILRDYLCNCLLAFEVATRSREKWYGRNP